MNSRRLAYGAVLFSFAGVALAWYSFRPLWYLPDPRVADQRSLLHWIALRDLQQYPADLQLALVNRFQADIDPRILASQSPPGSRSYARYEERIQKNAELLKKVWFDARCREYESCSAEQRYDFLDQQLHAVFAWSAVFGSDSSAASASDPPGTQTASQLLGQIEDWVSSATAGDKPRMRRAVQDATICWLSSTDLEPFTAATRRYIAERIARELGESELSSAQPLPLTGQQQQRLQQNALLLIEAWINWQADEYALAAVEQRQAMIDQCLDQVRSWHLERLLAGGGERKPANMWITVAANLPLWVQQAEPPQRERLQMFVAHLQQRFFWRSLQKKKPSSTR